MENLYSVLEIFKFYHFFNCSIKLRCHDENLAHKMEYIFEYNV